MVKGRLRDNSSFNSKVSDPKTRGIIVRDIVNAAIRLLENEQDFVLATIVQQFGSGPRSAGARMVVRRDGTIAGTVGGGALEAKVRKIAADVLENRRGVLMPFNLTADDSARMGMICGGEGSVFVNYIDARNPAILTVYRELAAVIESGNRARLVTFFPSEETGRGGSMCLIRPDGTIAGLSEHNVKGLEAIRVEAGLYHTFTILEQYKAVVEPVGYSGTAMIFGAGHVAQSLSPVLSSVDFRTVVLDDRKEFANRERFGGVDEIILLDSFDDAFSGLKIDGGSYIIIVTRGHLHDRTVLAQALGTKAAYIGMIGSRKKRDMTFQKLFAEGFTKADVDRVHAPIGLEIKAETPPEIAVSIVGELIRIRAELNGQK
ncbi:MAG: XdhC family aldehyde oxidoreductase maturation factor [Syntrophales bacterium]